MVGRKHRKNQKGTEHLGKLMQFSADRCDCNSVVADDEMGGQDVKDGSSGGGSGAGVVRSSMAVIVIKANRL